jgi:hypothetical protein
MNLHGVTSQKDITLIFTVIRTSNLVRGFLLFVWKKGRPIFRGSIDVQRKSICLCQVMQLTPRSIILLANLRVAQCIKKFLASY